MTLSKRCSSVAVTDSTTGCDFNPPNLDFDTQSNSHPVGHDKDPIKEAVPNDVVQNGTLSVGTDMVLWDPNRLQVSTKATGLSIESLFDTVEVTFNPLVSHAESPTAQGAMERGSIDDLVVQEVFPDFFNMQFGNGDKLVHDPSKIDKSLSASSNDHTYAAESEFAVVNQAGLEVSSKHLIMQPTVYSAQIKDLVKYSEDITKDLTNHRSKRVKLHNGIIENSIDNDERFFQNWNNSFQQDEDQCAAQDQCNQKKLDNQNKQRRIRSTKGSSKTDYGSSHIDVTSKVSSGFSDLFVNTNELLEAAQLNENRPKAPAFRSSNRREDALRDLLQNIKDPSLTKKDIKAEINQACQTLSGSHKKIKPFESKWHVFGMRAEASLPYHQLFGVAFLRKQEKEGEVHGGILADAPGLGKTIMMLSNIVNSHHFDKPNPGSTLIVGSRALVSQWHSEILKHCDPDNLPTLVKYEGIRKLGVVNPALELGKYAIVLATYDEVNDSHPDERAFEYETNPREKAKLINNRNGPLHRFSWARVVLDESHGIKNHKSKTARACTALKAKMKWAISGTPVMNDITEFYAYFAFLGMPGCDTMSNFKNRYLKSFDEQGVRELKTVLDRIMLRRLHSHIILGAKILDLPKLHFTTVTVKFGNLERKIYNYFAAIFRKKLSKASGNDQKRRAKLAGFTYLRLLTGHFLQIPLPLEPCLNANDLINYLDLTSNYSGVPLTTIQDDLREVLSKYDAKFEELERVKALRGVIQDSDSDHDIDDESDGNVLVPSANHCVLCDKKPPDQPFLTSCNHLYCKACLLEVLKPLENGNNEEGCYHCHDIIKSAKPLIDHCAQTQGSKPDKSLALPILIKNRILELQSLELLPLSAKMSGIMRQVESWLMEDPSGKIVIFTQFHGMITMLSLLFTGKNWGHCTYHGKRGHESRLKALREFEHNPEKKILLMSLKAGGVGLNLTMANRALLVDLWFNGSMEFQAYARIHRMGQERETTVVRLVVADSYDERILQIQGDKAERINGVMEPIKQRSEDALTEEEMFKLFADTGCDENDSGLAFQDVD